ncbi:putative ribonuclease [Chlorella vulgaris]
MPAAAGAAASLSAPGQHFGGSTYNRPAHHMLQRHYAVGPAAQLAANDSSEEEAGVGSLVEFERGKQYLLARVMKRTAQGWQVEVPSGTLYTIKAGDIKYVLPGGASRSSADLAALEAAAAREVAAADGLLLLAWELADGDSAEAPIFTVPGMADLLFNASDPASCAATLRLLREDKLYFKQMGRNPPMFKPRTKDQVDSLSASLRAQEEADANWARFAADIQQAKAAPRSEKPGEAAWRQGPHAERLMAVEGLALGTLPLTGPKRALAVACLVGLGKPPSGQDAAELLQSVGWWPPHLHFNLLSANITPLFSSQLEAAAQQLLASPPPDPDAQRRRDFTAASHAVVTIDDAATTEIDDGLSLERLPDGGLKVWVHVADPSRWVAPGSALAAEAQRRTKSLYLPTGTVPMFPKCLAEGPFSLRQGVAGEAVSVGMQLGADGELLLDSVEVVPSRVAPARRLTYNDVDEMLAVCEQADEQDLFELAALAALRQSYRMSCGAVEICMPESSLRVQGAEREDPDVCLEQEDQYASPARMLVSEMMILAGEAVGELGRRLAVPLPYRGQAQPVLPDEEELAAVPPGPCQAILLRNRMTRSVTMTQLPVPHAGLGLAAYVQFTSPIRRQGHTAPAWYGDLLAHWQLKAVLRGEQAPCDADQLTDIVEEVGSTVQRVQKLEREVEAYWVAEYFRQATKSDAAATWDAMFLCWIRQDVGLGRVLLGGLGLETVMRINQPMQAGERLYVRCIHTDVRQGMYRLEPVAASQVSQASVLNDSSRIAAPGDGSSSSSSSSDTYVPAAVC